MVNICINALAEGLEGKLIKSGDDTKLWGWWWNTLEDHITNLEDPIRIQKGLDSLIIRPNDID